MRVFFWKLISDKSGVTADAVAPAPCHPDCMSIQRSAHELAIWPAVEGQLARHRDPPRQRNMPAAQHAARAARKDRRRLGGHPDTDPTRAWPARQAGFSPIR